VAPHSAVLRGADFHTWVEVFAEGRWWVADPLRNRFEEQPSDYVVFSRIGGVENALRGYPRFRFEGDGLRVTMN
jgi:hypothetical protein